jgi:hypothetical protein
MKDKMMKAIIAIQCGLYSFKTKEKGAVNIVEIVVIIGIAVLLAVFFKGKIQDLLKSLFDSISGNATKAVN